MAIAFADLLHVLSAYPQTHWGVSPEAMPAWQALCNQLQSWQMPDPVVGIKNKDRKWEIVSAYQKSVRRGDAQTARKLVGAMSSLPDEGSYWWRRVCTTACEDLGPADDLLMNFVIACSTVFTPKATGPELYRVLDFLTEFMCAGFRSRDYCRMAIIQSWQKSGVIMDGAVGLGSDEEVQWFNLIKIMDAEKSADDLAESKIEQWARKNNWRGEGMLAFQILKGFLQKTAAEHVLPPVEVIGGLPVYAYDMHTRVGKAAIGMWVNSKTNKPWFKQFGMQDTQGAVGYALFFQEGGLLQREFRDPVLACVEQRVCAAGFGVSLDQWHEVNQRVLDALTEGEFLWYRKTVLAKQPYQ